MADINIKHHDNPTESSGHLKLINKLPGPIGGLEPPRAANGAARGSALNSAANKGRGL